MNAFAIYGAVKIQSNRSQDFRTTSRVVMVSQQLGHLSDAEDAVNGARDERSSLAGSRERSLDASAASPDGSRVATQKDVKP